jgi:hypothetical protein
MCFKAFKSILITESHGESMSVLEKKLSVAIIDPSVVTSSSHIRKLHNAEQRLFIPAALVKTIKEQKVDEILRYFVWWDWQAKLSPEFFELMEKAETYKYKEENVRDIFPELEKIDLPDYVKQILLDEYSFLKENSALLLRFRRTIQHFRNSGISTLDVMNKIKDEKERVFERIRGPRWIIAILLDSGALVEYLKQDPLWGTILAVSGIVLTVFDP